MRVARGCPGARSSRRTRTRSSEAHAAQPSRGVTPPSHRRRAHRHGSVTTVALFSLVVSGSVTLNARSAGAATTGTVRLTTPTADNHPYRHGAVPRRFSSSMSGPAPNAVPSTTGGAASLRPLSGGSAKAGSKLLSYGGGFSLDPPTDYLAE